MASYKRETASTLTMPSEAPCPCQRLNQTACQISRSRPWRTAWRTIKAGARLEQALSEHLYKSRVQHSFVATELPYWNSSAPRPNMHTLRPAWLPDLKRNAEHTSAPGRRADYMGAYRRRGGSWDSESAVLSRTLWNEV